MKALSIQSDVLGHKTYCTIMRHYFAQYDDLKTTSCWYRDGRSFASKVINKAAHVGIPFLSHNRDYWRFRVEWSQSRTARQLADRKLTEANYQILHFHTQAQSLLSTDLMACIPTIVSADMTTYQAAQEDSVRYPATYKPSIALERKSFHAAKHIITWSNWARQSVITDHGISAEKVTTISPGVRFDVMRVPVFAERRKPVILFMGRDFKRKGGLDLLEVFREHFSGVAELHIATDHEVPIGIQNVHLHYGVSAYTDRWHQLFQQADIFVMTSYSEALGLVFQEASAYGLALIGSDVGAVPEMIHDGENGFLLRAGDRETLARRIRALVENRELLLNMRKRSYDLALREFDAARNFRRMADIFVASATPGTV